MEVRHLELIVAICRVGTFSGAARDVGISQPTLSKSIARVEKELGLQLFDRTGGAARPTAYGQFVADRAEVLLRSMHGLTSELQQWSRGEAGRVRICVGPVTRLRPLPGVVEAIIARFPQMQIETRQERWAEIGRAVSQGRYELGFAYDDASAEFGELIRIKLFSDPVILAVRPHHPALRWSLPSAAQLLDYPLASFGVTPAFRNWAGSLSPEQNRNMRAFMSDDTDQIRERPVKSDYVAAGPRLIFEDYLVSDRLVELPTNWGATYECWMLTTETNWRSPIIRAIADFAKQRRFLSMSASVRG